MGLFNKLSKKDDSQQKFETTAKYGMLKIDEKNRLFKPKVGFTTFSFDDLVSFELLEDDHKVAEGGIDASRALLGGAFLGNAGAASGGLSKVKKAEKEYSTSIQILFTVKNHKKATHTISILASKMDKSNLLYSQHKILAKSTLEGFNYILNSNTVVVAKDSAIENYEDLKKLKELLDMGILSQEEFDTKKIELLK